MKKNKRFLVTAFTTFIFLFATVAAGIQCKTQPKGEVTQEKVTQEETKKETVTEKVKAYNDKLNEFTNFLNKIIEIQDKYSKMESDIMNEYSNAKSDQEIKNCAQKFIDIYSNKYNELLKVNVPDYAKGTLDSLLENVRQEKITWSCDIDNDYEGSSKAADKADEEYSLYNEQLESIMKVFNEEAKELGLHESFVLNNK